MDLSLLFYSIVTGVVGSFIASALFLLSLALLKPKLRVSDQLAKHVNENGNLVYTVKIINLSRTRAVDVEVEGIHVTKKPHNHGALLKATELNFVRARLFKLWGHRKDDKDAKYAWRVSITDDLSALWGSDHHKSIQVLVKARHPWSGFTTWVIKTYYNDKVTIKEGEFEVGNSMEIKDV